MNKYFNSKKLFCVLRRTLDDVDWRLLGLPHTPLLMKMKMMMTIGMTSILSHSPLPLLLALCTPALLSQIWEMYFVPVTVAVAQQQHRYVVWTLLSLSLSFADETFWIPSIRSNVALMSYNAPLCLVSCPLSTALLPREKRVLHFSLKTLNL